MDTCAGWVTLTEVSLTSIVLAFELLKKLTEQVAKDPWEAGGDHISMCSSFTEAAIEATVVFDTVPIQPAIPNKLLATIAVLVAELLVKR